MQVIKLCDHVTFTSKSNGSALKVALERRVPEVRGAKSATIVIVFHGVNASDVRVSFPYEAGPDGLHWEAFSTLFDSGDTTGVSSGTKHPSDLVDVTRFIEVQVFVQVEKTGAGASTSKSVTLSAWLVIKPF